MKKTLTLIAIFEALAAPAVANGYHRGPHDEPVLHADTMAIGHPGSPDLVDRTIHVSMLDADDGTMGFDVEAMGIAQGETIRFVLTNRDAEPHDFVMATAEEIADHRAAMGDITDMEHNAGYAARVEPGENATLVWTFANEGSFAFACLIPGHYEAGMHGRLTVD